MDSPRRIVSLLSSATEMLYLLGLGERVVGVSHECDYPPEVCLKARVTRSNVDSLAASLSIDVQVKSLLARGAPLYEIDVPCLVALEPELIVTQSQCDVCAVRYEDVLTAIRNQSSLHGVPIVALNPRSLSDVLADLQRVADAAGVGETGRQRVAELQARVDTVQRTTRELAMPKRPRVACIEWTDPLMLAANWMPELVDLAGGRHELTKAGVHSEYSSWDNLIDYNPQVIVVMPCGFELDRAWAETKSFVQRPGWSQLDAVQTGRVYAVNASALFNRAGPRLVDSLELLAHFVHPTIFNPPSGIDAISTWRAMSPQEYFHESNCLPT
jgi:iron complex transport system substrate-binding protein